MNKQLAEMVKEVVGYEGELVFDETKPDGTMQKLMEVERLNGMGCTAKTNLNNGIEKSYSSFLSKK